MQTDLIWTAAAFFLTILVLSYILGDNPLFRAVTYIFIGVSAGYVAVLLVNQILLPRLVAPLLFAPLPEKLLVVVPAVLSLLLLFKLSPRFSSFGNLPMAFLVGVGAAVAIGGAISGTLFTQIGAAITPFDLSTAGDGIDMGAQLLGGAILLFGTITTLAYFHFGAKRKPNQQVGRPAIIEILARFGQVFIAITLGALYAGVLAAALTALIERLDFLRVTFQSFIQ